MSYNWLVSVDVIFLNIVKGLKVITLSAINLIYNILL